MLSMEVSSVARPFLHCSHRREKNITKVSISFVEIKAFTFHSPAICFPTQTYRVKKRRYANLKALS